MPEIGVNVKFSSQKKKNGAQGGMWMEEEIRMRIGIRIHMEQNQANKVCPNDAVIFLLHPAHILTVPNECLQRG